jgi:hypothetical protein
LSPVHNYYRALIKYSKSMMQQCVADSDAAVSSMSSVIDLLIKDSGRISKMSADTVEALQNLQTLVAEVSNKPTAETLKKLIDALFGFVNQNRSVNEVIMPIVEALQFQDSIRQQMENMGKIMEAWAEARISLSENPTEAQITAIGTKFMTLTTMVSERDIIRKHISGLAEDVAVDSLTIF